MISCVDFIPAYSGLFSFLQKKGGKEALLVVEKGPALPVRARGAVVEIREKYWATVVRLYGGKQ